jgi:hypothetical protein
MTAKMAMNASQWPQREKCSDAAVPASLALDPAGTGVFPFRIISATVQLGAGNHEGAGDVRDRDPAAHE